MSQQEAAPARPLYDEVERIRVRNGWTRVQLAKKAGVSRGTIDNWKTQPRAPLAPTVKDVAERLGISPEMALRLAGVVPLNTPTPRERLADAMQVRVDELGLDWRSVISDRLDITQYPVETLSRRDKRHIEEILKWAAGSVDEVLAGGAPIPEADAAAGAASREPSSQEINERLEAHIRYYERREQEREEQIRQLQQELRRIHDERSG